MTDRVSDIFFELYEALPRQGPGNATSAKRALDLCASLPAAPAILDLGCGSGGATLHLAELTSGHITAVDNHPPLVERLAETVHARSLTERVSARVGDIGSPSFPPASFDLLWSEGALYFVGIEEALRLYAEVAKPGGYFVFTDAVWLHDHPPDDVKASFAEYPGMGSVADLLAIIDRSAWTLVDHFLLPEQAWWDDFYTPMEDRLDVMRAAYADDTEAMAILAELAKEPTMYRNHASTFGYELVVLRRD